MRTFDKKETSQSNIFEIYGQQMSLTCSKIIRKHADVRALTVIFHA